MRANSLRKQTIQAKWILSRQRITNIFGPIIVTIYQIDFVNLNMTSNYTATLRTRKNIILPNTQYLDTLQRTSPSIAFQSKKRDIYLFWYILFYVDPLYYRSSNVMVVCVCARDLIPTYFGNSECDAVNKLKVYSYDTPRIPCDK